MFTKAAVFDCDLFGRFSGENFRRLTDGGESVHSIPCLLVIKTDSGSPLVEKGKIVIFHFGKSAGRVVGLSSRKMPRRFGKPKNLE